MKAAVSQVPPLADKALKSREVSRGADEPLSARAALGVWIVLAASGWALLLGAAALIL